MQFVVFHSAFERETTEGPYDPARADRGTNSLIRAMDDAGMPPNSNVWCELGTTWREVMTNPTQAAHVVGKLLGRMGEDRVMWGTDAIWYGSPQPQIMAFRGVPDHRRVPGPLRVPGAHRPRSRRKIFGLNAASLLGLDPTAQLCAIETDPLTAGRGTFQQMHAAGEVTEPWRARGPITRREVLSWLRQPGSTLAPF